MAKKKAKKAEAEAEAVLDNSGEPMETIGPAPTLEPVVLTDKPDITDMPEPEPERPAYRTRAAAEAAARRA